MYQHSALVARPTIWPPLIRAERLDFVGLPPKPTDPPDRLRYSYERVAEEIQAFLNRKRGNQARIAEALDIQSADVRHRMNQRKGSRFSIEEIAVIADVADAPVGWPWLKWEDAEKVDAILKLVKSK